MNSRPDSLQIRLHDEIIGELVHIGGGRTVFDFDQSYVQNPQRSTLSVGFFDHTGQLNTHTRSYQQRIAPFFSNLLPEGPLRRYLAKSAGVDSQDEYALLAALGTDLPGAVTATPTSGSDLKASDLPSECDATAVETNLESDGRLRFSLAGIQLKFSAVRDAAGGLTIPTTGRGGQWILKLPSPEYDALPENEFSMMTLAKLVGIDTPEFDLIAISDVERLPQNVERFGSRAFVIRRFDRSPLSSSGALHIEDFAQVFGVFPQQKYEKAGMKTIGRVISQYGTTDDQAELVRRVVFNTMIGNGDMHLKNWSLIYPDGRNARLSPAYDLVSTVAYIEGDDMALTLDSTKRFAAVNRNELARFASKAGFSEQLAIDTAEETVDAFMTHWSQSRNDLPIATQTRNRIDTHLETLTLVHR